MQLKAQSVKALANDFQSDSVAVVIVNWNNWQLSLDCLTSLRRSQNVNWHLYLVDNDSNDASADHFQDLGDDVTVILSDINGGWTGGNNLAVRRALEDHHPFVFILNNDALVESNTIHNLQQFFYEHGNSPVLGPIHFDHDGLTLEFIGAQQKAQTGLADITRVQGVDLASLPPAFPTAFIKGAGIFAAAEHFAAIGLFDNDFYLNYDDTDWCFRARERGYELLMVRSARIIHAGSGSIGGAWSPLNAYFLARNELLFAERHCRWHQRPAQMIEFLRRGNRFTSRTTFLQRTVALLFGNQPTVRAWRLGVRDYVLRRFGDCPTEVRLLGRDH